MRSAAKRPLCGHCQAGWIEDDEGNITGRCPCRQPAPDRKAEGLAAAASKDAQMRAALRIILDAARQFPTVSANSVRYEMQHAAVDGPVRGAAFTRAVAHGWLEPVAQEASDADSTHGKAIAVYKSLEYGKAVAS